jgi:hypothetical protein
VIEALRRSLLSFRLALAEVLGLRWARAGRIDLAIPAALGLVVVGLRDELGQTVGDIPFGLAWLAASLALLGLAWGFARLRLTGRLRPIAVLAIPVVVSWLLIDFRLSQETNHLYDLNVYLDSAARWLGGGQPYMSGPISAWPSSAASDFFLYPPPLLPVFGALSELPNEAVSVAWVAFLVACAFGSFRALGLRPLWCLLLVAFPPVAIGIESGNVASLTFMLFALAYRASPGLVVDGLFKVQTGLPALWLARERRWRGLVLGAAAVVAIVLVTLPLTGLDAWLKWADALDYRAESQPAVPPMFGSSYAREMPGPIFVAISVGLVGLALAFRGRRGLAGLGLASIFASPSLWPHGFAFGLPAVLLLESGTAVWLALGLGAVDPGYWVLFYGGWLAILAWPRRPNASHPLGGTDGPWPGRARRRAGPATHESSQGSRRITARDRGRAGGMLPS